jgi:hypothetical protein
LNLIEVIKTIESDITNLEIKKKKELEKINEDYDKKIEELKIALDVNEKMNTYCLNCDGRGFYMQLDSAGVDSDQVKCEECRGSGRNLK